MIPYYAKEIISKKHGQANADLIEANWFFYADQGMRFGDSTAREILSEASLVLKCVATDGDLSKKS